MPAIHEDEHGKGKDKKTLKEQQVEETKGTQKRVADEGRKGLDRQMKEHNETAEHNKDKESITELANDEDASKGPSSLSQREEVAKSTVPPKPKVAKQQELPGAPAGVIVAISGRKVTVTTGRYGEERNPEDEEIAFVAMEAVVTLNGNPTTLAGLDNGDTVVFGGKKKNEYLTVNASRSK